MQSAKRKLAIWITLTSVFSALTILPLVSATTETAAAAAIEYAENTIVACYNAALDAEKAGANITSLTHRLNNAGDLVSKAKLEYQKGDFEAAIDFASRGREKLNGFITDATVLQDAAAHTRFWDFMINIVGSLVGSIAVVCIGFAVWVFLKRKYEKTGGVNQ